MCKRCRHHRRREVEIPEDLPICFDGLRCGARGFHLLAQGEVSSLLVLTDLTSHRICDIHFQFEQLAKNSKERS